MPSAPSERHDLSDRGALDRLLGGLGEHPDRDQDRGAGVVELEPHLLGAVRRVDRRHRASGDGGAVEGDRVLGDVRGHQAEHVALAEPAGLEAACEPVDQVAQLGVGVRAARGSVHQRDAVGEFIGAAEDVVGDRRLGDLDVGNRAAMDDHPRRIPTGRRARSCRGSAPLGPSPRPGTCGGLNRLGVHRWTAGGLNRLGVRGGRAVDLIAWASGVDVRWI